MININIDEKTGISSLSIDDEELIWDIQPILYINGIELFLSNITRPLIIQIRGRDNIGLFNGWKFKWYLADKPLIETRIKYYFNKEAIIFQMKALRTLKGVRLKDSFLTTTYNYPAFRISDDVRVLYYTWGLTGSEDYPRGYWPEAFTSKGIMDVTEHDPFSPFIISGKSGTLVLSAFNMFPISPMRRRGDYIMRGIHGSINIIKRGFTIETVGVYGRNLIDALNNWGSFLLMINNKKPIGVMDHLVLRSLGYWSSYGGYYSELFHPLDENTIKNLYEYFKKMNIKLGYIGLDSWYIFDKKGFVKEYKPNPQRFSKNLDKISDEIRTPFILHLSVLSKENYYSSKYNFISKQNEQSSVPIDKKFYDNLAEGLVSEGAIAVLQDWIRIQQNLVKKLRSDPEIAEVWFNMMAESFAEKKLAMILSMPTIGFILSSVKHQNVIAIRSYNDYIMSHKGQLRLLRKIKKVRWKTIPKGIYIKQNFMMSMLIRALGMLPFFDLFITNSKHPEGFAEPNAKYEALMRILSGGIIAVGDKIGYINKSILKLLLTKSGELAKPDEPAIPWENTIESDILFVHTYSKKGKYQWKYIAIANTGYSVQSYSFDLEKIFKERINFVYDYFKKYMITGSRITGNLKPGQIDYYIVPPIINGIALLGFIDNFITMPSYLIDSIRKKTNQLIIKLKTTPSKIYKISVFPDNAEIKSINGGVKIRQIYFNNFKIITLKSVNNLLEIKFIITQKTKS